MVWNLFVGDSLPPGWHQASAFSSSKHETPGEIPISRPAVETAWQLMSGSLGGRPRVSLDFLYSWLNGQEYTYTAYDICMWSEFHPHHCETNNSRVKPLTSFLKNLLYIIQNTPWFFFFFEVVGSISKMKAEAKNRFSSGGSGTLASLLHPRDSMPEGAVRVAAVTMPTSGRLVHLVLLNCMLLSCKIESKGEEAIINKVEFCVLASFVNSWNPRGRRKQLRNCLQWIGLWMHLHSLNV